MRFFAIILFALISFTGNKVFAQWDPDLDTIYHVAPEDGYIFGPESYLLEIRQDPSYDWPVHGYYNIYVKMAEIKEGQTAEDAMWEAELANEFFVNDTVKHTNATQPKLYLDYPYTPTAWYAYQYTIEYDSVDNLITSDVLSFRSQMLVYGFMVRPPGSYGTDIDVIHTESTSMDDVTGIGKLSTSRRSDTIYFDHIALNTVWTGTRTITEMTSGYVYTNKIDETYYMEDDWAKAVFRTDSLVGGSNGMFNFIGDLDLTTHITLDNGDTIRFNLQGQPMEYYFGSIIIHEKDIADPYDYNLLDEKMFLNFNEYFYSLQAYNDVITISNDISVNYEEEDINITASKSTEGEQKKLWETSDVSGSVFMLDSALALVPKSIIVDYDDEKSDSVAGFDETWKGMVLSKYSLKGRYKNVGGLKLGITLGILDTTHSTYLGSSGNFEINVESLDKYSSLYSNNYLNASIDSIYLKSGESFRDISGIISGELYLPLIDTTDNFVIEIVDGVISPAKFENLPFSFDSLAGFEKTEIEVSVDSLTGVYNAFSWDKFHHVEHYQVSITDNNTDEVIVSTQVSTPFFEVDSLSSRTGYSIDVTPVFEGGIVSSYFGNKVFYTPYYQETITSVDDVLIKTNEIFPNPVNDILYLSTQADKVEIRDLKGKLILSQNESQFNEKIREVNTSHLSEGSYIVTIHNNGTVISKKIIKQ